MKTSFSGSLLARAAILASAALVLAIPTQVIACGGFFAAAGRIITQPGETVFIDFDSATKTESFVVQAKFTGDAADFGMLLPVPSKPTLNEMPKEFFSELSVFTALAPLDASKYLVGARGGFGGGGPGGSGGGRAGAAGAPRATTVEVLETGVVGTLEYKTIAAEKPDDLYQWLKDNNYSYAGDEDTLKYYIDKKWVFVAMKIDSKQVTAGPDGKFSGQITPTRFTFASDQAVYPMHMTQMSTDMTRENGMDKTDVLFYIQSDHKMDLGGDFSYEYSFVPMWTASFAQERGSMVTDREFAWNKVVSPISAKYNEKQVNIRNDKQSPAVLMFAKKMTPRDVSMIEGAMPFDRRATPDQADKLKQLQGSITAGKYLTKIRKIFSENELNDDLVFIPATVNNTPDDMEYYETLPTTAAAQQVFTVAAPPAVSAIQRNVQSAINNLNGASVAGRGGFVEKARADLAALNQDLGVGLAYNAIRPAPVANSPASLPAAASASITDILAKIQPEMTGVGPGITTVTTQNGVTTTRTTGQSYPNLRAALRNLNASLIQLRNNPGGDWGGLRDKIIADFDQSATDIIAAINFADAAAGANVPASAPAAPARGANLPAPAPPPPQPPPPGP